MCFACWVAAHVIGIIVTHIYRFEAVMPVATYWLCIARHLHVLLACMFSMVPYMPACHKV